MASKSIVSIEPLLGSGISELISLARGSSLDPKESGILEFCQSLSVEVWTGYVEGKLICCWGLIPPTLLSNQAYLWMHSTPAVRDHQFLLVRHSQRVIEQMLEHYEKIIGDCLVGAEDSMRWLKWLGADFSEANDNGYCSFTIRRKPRG